MSVRTTFVFLIACCTLSACGDRSEPFQNGSAADAYNLSAEDAADIEKLKSDARNLADIERQAHEILNRAATDREAQRAEWDVMRNLMNSAAHSGNGAAE